MVRREVDRRTALVAMGSVLMTTSLGYLVVKDHLVPDEVKGGTFTLTVGAETTGTIAYDAVAATVKTALELLTGVNLVAVTGARHRKGRKTAGKLVAVHPAL